MVTLTSIILSLKKGDQFTTLNMRDACFHLDICLAHGKFLRFIVGQNYYHYRVLVFGLAVATRVFTKPWLIVVAQFCCRKLTVFRHLNNWLLLGRCRPEIRTAVLSLLSLLCSLDICRNTEKPI